MQIKQIYFKGENIMSKFKKPNWYPEGDIEAKKQGWVYTKNHDEVLAAIPHLDSRIAAEGETPEEVVPPVAEPEPESPPAEGP